MLDYCVVAYTSAQISLKTAAMGPVEVPHRETTPCLSTLTVKGVTMQTELSRHTLLQVEKTNGMKCTQAEAYTCRTLHMKAFSGLFNSSFLTV